MWVSPVSVVNGSGRQLTISSVQGRKSFFSLKHPDRLCPRNLLSSDYPQLLVKVSLYIPPVEHSTILRSVHTTYFSDFSLAPLADQILPLLLVTQRRLVVSCRLFGKTYRSHLQRSCVTLGDGTDRLSRNVGNYQSKLLTFHKSKDVGG